MHELYFAHDQQENPALRSTALELCGFRVTLFGSGTELLTALAEHRPDAILLDVLLNGPHGFDVCRLVRHQYAAEELPVILMSDIYREPAYHDEARAAGAQAYLLRPIDTDELIATLQAQLGAGQRAG